MRKRNDFAGVGGRKHDDFFAVGGTRTYTSRQFTVEMKARRILHEKTQRFLRGRWRTEEGVYISKEQRLMMMMMMMMMMMLMLMLMLMMMLMMMMMLMLMMMMMMMMIRADQPFPSPVQEGLIQEGLKWPNLNVVDHQVPCPARKQ